jgi:hypothetical protein
MEYLWDGISLGWNISGMGHLWMEKPNLKYLGLQD